MHVTHKNEVWLNSTSEQTHLGTNHIFTTAFSGYRTSVENVELSPLVLHNTFPDDNSRTTITISIRDITEMKLCPIFFPKKLVIRITCSNEATISRKDGTNSIAEMSRICAPYTTLNGATIDDQISKRCSVQDDGKIG
ncbi:hypothetical protein TNCV_3017751 [Trichonephila clavipes]|nr:hypothetical protein TNCV_3017751 [Trichonephila clavipes]